MIGSIQPIIGNFNNPYQKPLLKVLEVKKEEKVEELELETYYTDYPKHVDILA